MPKLILASLLALTFVSCSKFPQLGPAKDNDLASASEDDCGYVQNSYGQRISWKGSLPIHMGIPTDLPSQFIQPLKDAAKIWEDAAGMSLFVFDTLTTDSASIPVGNDGQNVVYWMKSWDSTQSTLQAVTSLHWYQNVIADADLKVDANYFNFYVSTPDNGYEIHMESLFLHELGHVLGLKHKTVEPTVMWATLANVTVRETLSATDIASLKCEY